MPVCASCYHFWVDSILIVSNHMKDRIRKNKPTDELTFLRVIEVEKFVVCCKTKYFAAFDIWYVDDAVDDDSSKGNILNSFVSFAL